MEKTETRIILALIWVCCLIGCTTHEPEPQSYHDLFMLPNEASYVTFENNSFIANLILKHPQNLKVDSERIQSIELQPATDKIDLDSFYFGSNSSQNSEIARKALSLDIEGKEPGSHTFTHLVLQTPDGEVRLDAGTIRVQVMEGEFGGLLALMKSGGVLFEEAPFRIVIKNSADVPVTLKRIVAPHPSITFEDQDIHVYQDGEPIDIFQREHVLKPEEAVYMEIDWDVPFPEEGAVNMDIVPLLVIERKGEQQYVQLNNMVFRKDPDAVQPLPLPSE